MNAQPQTRPVVVAGERVFLSHIFADDAPLLAQWFADLEFTALLGQQGYSYTLEQERQWINANAIAKDDRRTFAIILRDGERLIGTCSLFGINLLHGVAELGIAIGDKTVWGQGYGREAVRLLVDYGFRYLNLYNISLWLHEFNERAYRAYVRAGFREVGRLRGATMLDGRRYDRILMEITRDDRIRVG
ncbi:MAG: N-acetyltransferase [Chloroflexus sp.]|jgi:RimJ/RimL family protein N-acetyltransferase|uniref:GNAT family N-acetyltransferase n=1 Tax=Chloroflexus sp. TaxID=1904827 RepID=UPI000F2866C3|nr:GNAT family protein [Chloroflexus sp.]RMD77111.1 MAG: N-acetyltransferase [Chloroflexota bacterium]GIV88533.1 MAG: N-acetyltransferase [Chloroflexus sp.]